MSADNATAAGAAGAATTTTDDRLSELAEFQSVFNEVVNPKGNEATKKEAESAITALVKQALGNQALLDKDLMDVIASLTQELDAKLTSQINEIMHHEEFQALESAWTGLKYLVTSANPDATAKLRVMNVAKDELRDMLTSGEPIEDMPLYTQIYKEAYDMANAPPYGMLIGDYSFDHSDGDIQFLSKMGEIAQAAHAPFIASAAPSLMGFEDISELTGAPNLDTIMDGAAYSGWNGLRKEEQSRYLALTAPNVLARSPYAPGSANQVKDFDFVETVDGHDNSKYLWMNSAYAMGANVIAAHKEYGWTARIRGVQSGGMVRDLPMHVFDTGDGTMDAKCPTQVAIDFEREAQLSRHGMIGLLHRKNTNTAAFVGAQTLFSPTKQRKEEDTASERLSARLPYIFAVSRFSHYLKKMVHDMVGQSKEHDQLQKELTAWVKQYVPANPQTASEDEKARKPLADAKVEVVEDEENPGYYSARFYLRPHFQLEGMTVGMTLVSKVPEGK
jgi:type VI secretion system protein ImpC